MEYLWKETEELGDKERFLLYALHTFLEGNKGEGVGEGMEWETGVSRCRFITARSYCTAQGTMSISCDKP